MSNFPPESCWPGRHSLSSTREIHREQTRDFDSGLKHLKEMEEYANIPPAVNQIELHPWCQVSHARPRPHAS